MTSEETFISSILAEAQSKFNQKKYKESLGMISMLLTKNYNILSLRAKIYHKLFEYYKSLKDCEECINLLSDDLSNLELYQLSVQNYIKMFDLEKAKEKLQKCQSINKDSPKNEELFQAIKEEEKKKRGEKKIIPTIFDLY